VKVKILQSIAGPDVSFRPGQIVTLDDVLAGKWIKTGICKEEPAEEPAAPTENDTPKKARKK
jgi:hypothetical protein